MQWCQFLLLHTVTSIQGFFHLVTYNNRQSLHHALLLSVTWQQTRFRQYILQLSNAVIDASQRSFAFTVYIPSYNIAFMYLTFMQLQGCYAWAVRRSLYFLRSISENGKRKDNFSVPSFSHSAIISISLSCKAFMHGQ